MDKLSVFHPATSIYDQQTNGPIIYTRGQGARLTDRQGMDLIDFGAGLWCVNVGYGRREIAAAAFSAMQELSYSHMFGTASNEATIRLADRVLSLLREKAGAPHLARIAFGSSGSDANDTAFKLVRYYNNLRGRPEKKKIISRLGAYHGVSFASGSLTGIPAYHTAFDMPIEGVLHTSCPHYYRFAQDGESEQQFYDRIIADLSAMIERERPETIAAFIAEPVMGTGGVLIPSPDYYAKVQELLNQHDILLIVDEVITGFGRTGAWFGTGTFGLKPDIVNMAKGITSAYFPVSATAVSERIWKILEEASPRMGAFMHGFTYSGHPVGSAVAMANIDIIEREALVEKCAADGPYMLKLLQDYLSEHPFVGDVRGIGLMIGVEFVADRVTRRPFAQGSDPHRLAAKLAMQRGVVTRSLPFIEVNSFSPPLSISRGEIEEGVERYAAALKDALPAMAELAK
ncbi:aspartate aminotransferase family protein [Bradyrhizobium canariense]|nr:aspartate aminotransferase family protein [Bradyrhizobium canariense]